MESKRFPPYSLQKLGLSHIPSAFQIRYGGYKGVIAVNRHSFGKLSLWSRKFESSNCMLNITTWSKSQPCYLNMENHYFVIDFGGWGSGLCANARQSTTTAGNNADKCQGSAECVGQHRWRSNEKSHGQNAAPVLQGYEPRNELYLPTMVQSHLENQISDIRSRSASLFPKGRVLAGCLCESGILEYDQVFVRLTMTMAELEGGWDYFYP